MELGIPHPIVWNSLAGVVQGCVYTVQGFAFFSMLYTIAAWGKICLGTILREGPSRATLWYHQVNRQWEDFQDVTYRASHEVPDLPPSGPPLRQNWRLQNRRRPRDDI